MPSPVLAQRILEKGGGEKWNMAISDDMIRGAAENPEGEMKWYQNNNVRTGTGMEMLQALASASGISSGTKRFYDIEEKEKKQETRAEEAAQRAKDSLENTFEQQIKRDERTEVRDLEKEGVAKLMDVFIKGAIDYMHNTESRRSGIGTEAGKINAKRLSAFLQALKDEKFKDVKMTPQLLRVVESSLEDIPKPGGF